MEAQLAAAKKEATERSEQVHRLAAELALAQQKIQEAIQTGIEEQTSAVLRKWLAGPLETEKTLSESETCQDLLLRTEKLLELQAKQDRYTGNRAQLEQRLKTLESARQRAGVALASAINPIPELRPLLHDLDNEIVAIQKALSLPGQPSPLAVRLMGLINGSQTFDQARSCERLVQDLCDHSLLQPLERRAVYDALVSKASLLEEGQRSKGVQSESGWSLRRVLHRNENALVLVDGHNLLFTLSDIFQSWCDEDGVPRRKARQRLVDLAERLVQTRENVEVRICFDGPEATLQMRAPNLVVEYSGGNGEHRADQLIVARLGIKDMRNIDQKTFVVTDDRQVRREITPAGAKYVPNDIFAVLLADFHCLEKEL
jgi:hypothetical protein